VDRNRLVGLADTTAERAVAAAWVAVVLSLVEYLRGEVLKRELVSTTAYVGWRQFARSGSGVVVVLGHIACGDYSAVAVDPEGVEGLWVKPHVELIGMEPDMALYAHVGLSVEISRVLAEGEMVVDGHSRFLCGPDDLVAWVDCNAVDLKLFCIVTMKNMKSVVVEDEKTQGTIGECSGIGDLKESASNESTVAGKMWGLVTAAESVLVDGSERCR